jgi:Zn-finger nucleic acid-binding protein
VLERAEANLNCPKCNLELEPATRHGIKVAACPRCKGMWFDPQELRQLEDEVFDLDEHAKGTLVFSSTPTAARCPGCGAPLRRFNYRLYDLELEFCENGHGYWLEDGEDTRVLELMKKEEKDIERSQDAEAKWGAVVRRLHSGGFLDRVRDLFR